MATDGAGIENVIREMMMYMCRDKLDFQHKVDIQGLVAVTVDNKHVLLVRFDDVLKCSKSSDEQESASGQENCVSTGSLTLLSPSDGIECCENEKHGEEQRINEEKKDEVVIKEEVAGGCDTEGMSEFVSAIKTEDVDFCQMPEDCASQSEDNATSMKAKSESLSDVCMTGNTYSQNTDYSADKKCHSTVHKNQRRHSLMKARRSVSATDRYKDPRPHVCPVPECSASFTDSWILKRHMITHTGQKNFHCVICPHKCNLKENLRAHMQRIHKDLDRNTVEHLLNLAKS